MPTILARRKHETIPKSIAEGEQGGLIFIGDELTRRTSYRTFRDIIDLLHLFSRVSREIIKLSV